MTYDNASFPARTAAEDAEFFRDMRSLIKLLTPHANRNEIADILIRACIDHGMNRAKRIVAAVTHLGFDPVHVRIRLHYGRLDGSWVKDSEGYYSVAAPAEPLAA